MTNPNQEQVQISQQDIERNQYVLAGVSVGAVSGMLAGVGLETIMEELPGEIVAGSLAVTGAIAFGAIAKAIYNRRSSTRQTS